jgi:hypothetical protein
MEMTMAASDLERALVASIANPRSALAYVRQLQIEAFIKPRSTPELWVLRAILAREAEKPKTARGFTPREVEVFAALDQRRAVGELAMGSKHVLEIQALRAFALANGFPAPPPWLHLPEWDELVAADLLSRYGWSGGDAGAPLDDWVPDFQTDRAEGQGMSAENPMKRPDQVKGK